MYRDWEMYKQAIIVRTDLEMGRGKLAAQVAHAAVDSFYKTLRSRPEKALAWLQEGQKKVVLKVKSVSELLEKAEKASEHGLIVSIVRDAGLTQLQPGTVTCVGIGPDKEELIDRITGDLKLL